MAGSANGILADPPRRLRKLGESARPRDRHVTSPKMRVLHVLSSANQLYSGIGRNVFELAIRMGDRIAFEFAIDDLVQQNVGRLRTFCDRHGYPLHTGKARTAEDSLDPVNEDLPELLRQHRWDAIECLSWANAATNAAVLDNMGDVVLGYTPHNQPTWTVPMSPSQAAHIESVQRRLLRRADVVFCDSPWERCQLDRESGRPGTCISLPIGCDFTEFRPGAPMRRPQLLFVGDAREPRKRIDRVLAVLARLRRRRPELRLLMIGNHSEQIWERIPAELQSACELRGYVSETELRAAYAESLGLILLSEFEAFGIPILEALASGTPVFLSRLDETFSLFGSYAAAHFCPADDLVGTCDVIEGTLARGAMAIQEAIDARESLRAVFDWHVIAVDKWRSLAAAWYHRQKNRMTF
jgi:glycosyltransferase involved in cell wall biosynthesis